MGYFDNTRKNWIIGFLVILNIGLLISFWLPSLHGRPHENQDKINNQFRKKLGLDEAQFEKVKDLRKEHFRETRMINENIHELKKEMFGVLKGENPDTTKAYNLAQKIGQLEGNIDKSLINHFLDLRAVCNEDQKIKLDKFFHRAMKKPGGRLPKKGDRPPLRRD